MRKIIHIDMDAFFASVEQRERPELKGKPIAVGGGGMRGVVAAASYEARKYGVRSAMPSVTAKRLCPELIFVKHQFGLYKEISQQIRSIFHEYTDLVEPLSLDEAYLDVTEAKKGPKSGTLIAEEIRARIYQETQLTASAGVSYCKFLAKIASDINKPNGIKIILPEDAESFIAALPIEKFHGIGKKTAEKMHRMSIYIGADLRARSEIELIKRFGKSGRWYYRISRGQDERPVNPTRIRKSVGAERTYSENISKIPEMKEKLEYLCERVFTYMETNENFGRTLTLKMKTPDFQILTRSKSFNSEVTSLAQMKEVIFQLLEENHTPDFSVRLLGVSVSNLQKELTDGAYGIQLKLNFED